MAVHHAERSGASRLLTGMETRRGAQGDYAHGILGCQDKISGRNLAPHSGPQEAEVRVDLASATTVADGRCPSLGRGAFRLRQLPDTIASPQRCTTLISETGLL